MIFMFPLGFSMALTVQMGEAWGAGRMERLRPIALSGWLMVAGFTCLSAPAFLFFNETIAGWFLTDESAMRLAASLLVISAVFQFGDALQIVSSGALRALDDVTVPAWIAFSAYWGLAIPFGWWLAFPLEGGVVGMWWGISAGLFLTAVVLGSRLWLKTSPKG